MLILSRSDTLVLADLPACVAAVRAAFAAHGRGRSLGVARVHLRGLEGGEFHLTAGGLSLDDGEGAIGLKLNGRFPPVGGQGGQRVAGAVLLSDAATGRPLALLDSMLVTSLRTAAITAVVVDLLARRDASSALLVGAGRQARGQVDALRESGRVSVLSVFDLSPSQAEEVAAYARQTGLEARAVGNVRDAASRSDVIVTVTPARAPILFAEDVSPGSLVVALGADGPGKQELDVELLSRASVVVDITEQAAASGELQHALAGGGMTIGDVHAELGQILVGDRPGRTSDEELFVFDGTGTAFQDLAAAMLLVERAEAGGFGLNVALDA